MMDKKYEQYMNDDLKRLREVVNDRSISKSEMREIANMCLHDLDWHVWKIARMPMVGDRVETPRFLHVELAAVFRDEQTMRMAGFMEPTHLYDKPYVVCGKNIGVNRMMFAAALKQEEE